MERGYTLLELVITLAVLAIVTFLAVPAFQDSVARNARESAMLELMTALALARSEAVNAGTAVALCRSDDLRACAGSVGDWSSGWLVFSDAGTPGQIDDADVIVRVQPTRRVGGAVMLHSTTGVVAGEYLRFSGEGFLVHPGAAYFQFCTDDAAAGAIRVASSGRAAFTALQESPTGAALECP